MGKFINQDDRGFACKGRVDIEFLQDCATVLYALAQHYFQSLEQRFSLFAAVSFDQSAYDIDTFGDLLACGFEHGVSLANARSGTEEYL